MSLFIMTAVVEREDRSTTVEYYWMRKDSCKRASSEEEKGRERRKGEVSKWEKLGGQEETRQRRQ